jgi:Predicted xylanase/chitin deacetylase
MILKKILSFAASIIKFFIFIFFTLNSNAETNNIKYYSEDLGTLSLMYHRFDENKYPSTNIRMDIFKKQISIIEQKKYEFYNPKEFDSNYKIPKSNKKILLTIDDAFSSFYENAWPFLKEKKIPFILFVSTEPIGKHGYMKWEEIKEMKKKILLL